LRRRTLLSAALAGGALVGCATAGESHIVASTGGRLIGRTELVERLRGCDYVLLGERHDNPVHHVMRGELLAELGAGTAVVAEQLPSGGRVIPGARAQLEALQAAGFDARGWGWPLHEPLFAAVAHKGFVLEGGNLPRELARRVGREGAAALPAAMRAAIAAAPLPPEARAALDTALVQGHCGQLAGPRLEAMHVAQRARDASLWLAMQRLHAAGARPVVLVAGNGHVRRDHGVPRFVAAVQPQARVMVVGFGEPGDDASPYDVLWVAPRVERSDPCAGFQLPGSPAPMSPAVTGASYG